MANASKQQTRVSPKGRFSYPTVYRAIAQKNKDGSLKEAEYSVDLIFDKNDPGVEEMRKVATEALQSKFNAAQQKKAKFPIKDGDEKIQLATTANAAEKYAAYAGKVYVTFKKKERFGAPQVVGPAGPDGKAEKLPESSNALYAGCYGRVSYTVYTYNAEGNVGVSFGLANVQKLEDGEPLQAVSSDAADDFGVEIEKPDTSVGIF